jgi:hypothetical protein
LDNKKSITALTDKNKKAYSVYKTITEYEEIRKLWLSMGYTNISEYEE